jgi:hypothetical protein
MSKARSWYDPRTETSSFLTALAEARLKCNRAEHVLPHAKVPGSLTLIDAIKAAIDDYAEREMGTREFFWGKPPSVGRRLGFVAASSYLCRTKVDSGTPNGN